MTFDEHDLYQNGDKDIHKSILDQNGQVVLALCKRCGKGEIELGGPCLTDQDKLAACQAEIMNYQHAIEKQRERCDALKQGWLEAQAENAKLREAIAKARKEEREACAKLCDKYVSSTGRGLSGDVLRSMAQEGG